MAVPPPPIPSSLWTAEELTDLQRAKILLENPGLAARLTSKLGNPIERGFKMLPAGWADTVHRTTRNALFKALEVAILSLGSPTRSGSSERGHRLAAGAIGGLGGVFGLAALAVELPVSTTLMLRSIAEIARSEGHNLNENATRLACLEVFALGGRSAADDAAESSYWAVRAALAKAVSEALSYLGERRVLEKSAPALVRLITAIASRFGVVVSEQMAAKAIPLVGAASGAAINFLFMEHFQSMARGHFIVRRLERAHGAAAVKLAYDELAVPC